MTRDRAFALALVLAALALYAPALFGGFVWDDTALAGDPASLRAYGWLEPLWNNRWHAVETARFYRPMVFWSHRIDLALWGEAPAGHHATNVLVFGALVLTLVALLRQMGLTRASWAAAALLFVTHPAHAEVVSWVAGRPDLLAALGALAFALGVFRRWPLPLTFAALLGALLAKEVAVAVPVALFVAALGRRRDGESGPWDAVTPSAVAAPCALALGVYLALRLGCPGLARGYPYGAPQSATELALVTATNVKLAGRYLAMLVSGRDYGPLAFSEMIAERRALHLDAAGHLRHALDRELALALVALTGVGAACARAAWRDRAARFAVVLGALSLVMSMNLTSARHQIAFGDRYLFVPSVAAAVGLAAIPRWPRPALGAALVAGVIWSAVTVQRTARYADALTFWTAAVVANPGSAHARHMRAVELVRAGRSDEAVTELDRALALDPMDESAALRASLRPATGTPSPAPTP